MMNDSITITQLLTRNSGSRPAKKPRPLPLMVRILRWLDRRSPAAVCAVAASLIVSIGILSYVTGPQISSSLLYLIPVLLVTRVAGFIPGVAAALLAALIWFAADMNGDTPYDHPVIPYWNAVMRLGTFLVAVSVVSAMRALNSHLEERVRERTSDLERQNAEKRTLEKNILEISDLERARIGQDLHDGLCQQLVSAAFSANSLREQLEKTSPSCLRDTNRIADMIDDAITQARNLARGLYPVRLETEGLEMALRELVSTQNKRFGVACTVECPEPIPPCKASAGIHLYRIAQEALVNAAKHAGARRIVMSLTLADSRVTLVVEDDGIGIAKAAISPGGMGLRIMEYRARMIGAEFGIESLPQGGTRVACELNEAEFRA